MSGQYYQHPFILRGFEFLYTPREVYFYSNTRYHISTLRMTRAQTSEKKQKIKRQFEELLTKSRTIRKASSLLGSIVASFEAVPNGRLHYRHIELDKISALKQNQGNFETRCYLSQTAIAKLSWWLDNILQVYRVFKSTPEVDYTIFSDASTNVWGAHDKHHTIIFFFSMILYIHDMND